MNIRKERTLRDLCDATPTLSQPQITPVLRGSFRMQGPVDEANCGLPNHMVESKNNKGISTCFDRSQKVDYGGKSGTCNVCSAPCSSCFHVNKVLMRSYDESAGETSAENMVVGGGRQGEIGQQSESVACLTSATDSFSENAVGKAPPKTSNASALDDNVVHSKSKGQRDLEGPDDCLSCGSETDERANRKTGTEDSRKKYDTPGKTIGEISDDVPQSCSPTRLCSQNSGLVEIHLSMSTDNASELLNVKNTFAQASHEKYVLKDPDVRDVNDEKPSDTKDKMLEGSPEHLDSLPHSHIAFNVFHGDLLATDQNSLEKNDDMEVDKHRADETDDSDIVEHDVKVCDICGDAGREDLLAICCRCSDGAEHTYCMLEMLAKVPEGEWMCEECKIVERERNRPGKIGRVDENEKNITSGQTRSDYINSSDGEGHRTKCYNRNIGKRLRDDVDADVSSVVKKPALESMIELPKPSGSSKKVALTREKSFNNVDKGRLQSLHHSFNDTVPVNDTTEPASSASDVRVQNLRGTISKSNSFNVLSSKPKVKLVDQVVIKKGKLARGHGSFRLKDDVAKSMGKSVSFKSTMSSRADSKMKILSPRLSQNQDMRNTENSKERSTFERQRSFRTEHPSVNSMMNNPLSSTSRIDKRAASQGDSSSLTTIANPREIKSGQGDGKSAALSRSSSFAARKTVDLSNSSGDKRLSTYGQNTLGFSAAIGVNNSEKRSYKSSAKEDSSSVVAERPSFNANEGLSHDSTQPRDSTNTGERMRELLGSRLPPTSVKSCKDEGDSIKAAIEAAVLRKPGIYRKRRTAEVTERPTVPRSPTVKQETLHNVEVPLEGVSSRGADCVHVPSARDVLSNVPAAIPFSLKLFAIPELDYIWQGSFEIYRNGNFDLKHGIQAHLSTCASPKVIEAVNNFQSRIVLYEVPRLTTWPIQFEEHGVREDNIALFFFAKDVESYDTIYKVLLDNMMKNDLALKGNINGVELLIFPSDQLPDNSNRWNRMFFLWGVFRGKKESSLQNMPEPLNHFCAPRDIPPAIMSLLDNKCSSRPITEDLPASIDTNPMLEVPISEDLRSNLSSSAFNGDCGANSSSLDQQDGNMNLSSLVAVQSGGAKQCQQIRATCQEEGTSSSCSPNSRQRRPIQMDNPLDRQLSLHHSNKSAAGTLKEGIDDGTILDETTCNQDQLKLRTDAVDLSKDGGAPLEEDRQTRDLNMEPDKWPFKHEEHRHPLEPGVGTPNLYAGTSQVSIATGDEPCGGVLEKMNHLLPNSSIILQNRGHEASLDTVATKYNGTDAEQRFFPEESQPIKGVEGSTKSWKMLQDRVHDITPNLELALGAERKSPTQHLQQDIRPLLINKPDQQFNKDYILDESRTKSKDDDDDDDVSASLSLSLSFPFPDKEQSTKSDPKTEKQLLVAKTESIDASVLFFGSLRNK